MKIAFITSLFGEKIPQPSQFKRAEGHDYFLFGDKEQKDFNTSWEVHNISSNPIISNLNCNIRRSRYAKFMGWELLSSMDLHYDFIFYCDVHYSPNPDTDWCGVCKKILSRDFAFLQDVHDNNKVRQLGIIEECKGILFHGRDTEANMEKTINFFKQNYPSVNLSASQYFQNTMFGYSPNSKAVKSLTSEFWKLYTTANITYRDQPIWNLLLLKNDLIPASSPNLKNNLFKETGQYGDHLYAPRCNLG